MFETHVMPNEGEHKKWLSSLNLDIVLWYHNSPLVIFNYMHTGGRDQLWNLPFSQLSDLRDLDHELGRVAYGLESFIDLSIDQILFKLEKLFVDVWIDGQTYGLTTLRPALLGQCGRVKFTMWQSNTTQHQPVKWTVWRDFWAAAVYQDSSQQRMETTEVAECGQLEPCRTRPRKSSSTSPVYTVMTFIRVTHITEMRVTWRASLLRASQWRTSRDARHGDAHHSDARQWLRRSKTRLMMLYFSDIRQHHHFERKVHLLIIRHHWLVSHMINISHTSRVDCLHITRISWQRCW